MNWREHVGANLVGLPLDELEPSPLRARPGRRAALPGIIWRGSPNYTPGHGLPVDLLVLHTIVGRLEAADRRFTKWGEYASAHYGVAYDRRIWQWVDEWDTSWANGVWSVNQRSLTIEHEDNGVRPDGSYDDGPRPDSLYETSGPLVLDLAMRHNIPLTRVWTVMPGIIGHRWVGYATACPDALDLDRIIRIATSQEDDVPLSDQEKRILAKLAEREDVVDELMNKGNTVRWLLDNLGTLVEKANAGQRALDALEGVRNAFGQLNFAKPRRSDLAPPKESKRETIR